MTRQGASVMTTNQGQLLGTSKLVSSVTYAYCYLESAMKVSCVLVALRDNHELFG